MNRQCCFSFKAIANRRQSRQCRDRAKTETKSDLESLCTQRKLERFKQILTVISVCIESQIELILL